MNKSLRYTLLALAIVGFNAGIVAAQKKGEDSMQCRDSYENDRLQSHCEIKEQTLSAGGAIAVDAGQNGGVTVRGWERNEILVRARIQTAAPTQAQADQLAREVRIETALLRIHAEGPEQRNDFNWWVSFEIYAPNLSDLSLEAHNGGISLADVHGKIDFQTQNGGVNLRRVGGNVRGHTTNGGVNVELAGARWEGELLEVRTTNGGVNLALPDSYSAHLETGTVNGRVSFDFPVNVPMTERGRLPRDITIDLGSGGPTIRLVTTNGGVRVRRSPARGMML